MIRPALLALALLSLPSCAPGSIDNAGYLLPERCRAPADLPHANLETITGRAKITQLVRGQNLLRGSKSANAVTLTFPDGTTFIFVADDLSPDDAALTLRHERCHVLLGNWHP